MIEVNVVGCVSGTPLQDIVTAHVRLWSQVPSQPLVLCPFQGVPQSLVPGPSSASGPRSFLGEGAQSLVLSEVGVEDGPESMAHATKFPLQTYSIYFPPLPPPPPKL